MINEIWTLFIYICGCVVSLSVFSDVSVVLWIEGDFSKNVSFPRLTLFAHPWMCILYWQSSPCCLGDQPLWRHASCAQQFPTKHCGIRKLFRSQAWMGQIPEPLLGRLFLWGTKELPMLPSEIPHQNTQFKETICKQRAVPRDVGKPVLPTEDNIEHKSWHDFCKNSHISKKGGRGIHSVNWRWLSVIQKLAVIPALIWK